jgi:hypothetical protein
MQAAGFITILACIIGKQSRTLMHASATYHRHHIRQEMMNPMYTMQAPCN